MQFFGKYRGKVANNVDPKGLGRLQVSVPAVLGDGRLSWALPCMPSTNFFILPPKGANIWVEFEGGDLEHPIWTGCFWNPGQVPARPATEQVTLIKTQAITLTLSDVAGLSLEVKPPASLKPLKLVMNKAGIELNDGKNSVKLTPISVNVNSGALEVI